jgi:hypothetical protein
VSASAREAAEFRAAFRTFLRWVEAQTDEGGNEVVALVRNHLGPELVARSVVSKELPSYEHVNLQVALDHWVAQPGREVHIHGVAVPPHWSGLTLQQLLTGEGLPPVRLCAPSLIDLPSGPGGQTLACLVTAVLLLEDQRGRYVLMIRGPEPHEPPLLDVEVAGLPVSDAQAVQSELTALRSTLSVYRGQVLELGGDDRGGLRLLFADLPHTGRDEVVLPEAVLQRIEQHTVGVAAHRTALLAAGQHLKRGLLLYGPPGTGKTHTTRYVVGQMSGCTRLLLSGRFLHLIGAINELARELQPAVAVLEDVDLVAEDRGFGPGSSPVLFDLLDAMDGAAADADLLFILTTNRADLLEPALAARPGRVDIAVEIGIPDADARRRLLELYSKGVPLELSAQEAERVIERTEGTTASFIKELLRRAVLEALEEASPFRTVSGAHVARALDELLDSTQRVTRALLGVGDADALSPRVLGRTAGGHGGLEGVDIELGQPFG